MTEGRHPLQDIAQPATYLHIENAQLKQQLAQMQALVNQRHSQAVLDLINGLVLFTGLAQAGDQGAQQILRGLAETLDKVREQASPITVIHSA